MKDNEFTGTPEKLAQFEAVRKAVEEFNRKHEEEQRIKSLNAHMAKVAHDALEDHHSPAFEGVSAWKLDKDALIGVLITVQAYNEHLLWPNGKKS